MGIREQQRVLVRVDEPRQMVLDHGQQVGRHLDVTAPGVGFGSSDFRAFVEAHNGPLDADNPVRLGRVLGIG